MKNKRVIALIATAGLIVSVPVTSMAGDTLGTSFQTSMTDVAEEEQSIEDTADAETVGKSLSDSDTDEAVPDSDSPASDNPYSISDTVTSGLSYAVPDTSSSIDASIDTSALQKQSATDEEVIVPEGVTRIGRDAFKNNTTIRRVVLPESCDYIQYAIFTTCTNLEEVVINCKTITFSSTNIFGSVVVTVYGYPYSEVPAYCAKYTNVTFVAMEQPESEKFTIRSSACREALK